MCYITLPAWLPQDATLHCLRLQPQNYFRDRSQVSPRGLVGRHLYIHLLNQSVIALESLPYPSHGPFVWSCLFVLQQNHFSFLEVWPFHMPPLPALKAVKIFRPPSCPDRLLMLGVFSIGFSTGWNQRSVQEEEEEFRSSA